MSCVRGLIIVTDANMHKMVRIALPSVPRPSTPMLAAYVCRVILTAQNQQAVQDRWTLSVLEHVTRVHWCTLTTWTVCRQCVVCELTPSVVLVSTAASFLSTCVVLASENWQVLVDLTPLTPAVPNCCCSKGSAPYWSNPPFLIFDIRALWHSELSARVPECQKL